MKFTNTKWSIALTLLAAVAFPLGVAAQVTATQNQKAKHHHYIFKDLGTLGGPTSGLSGEPFTEVINNAGTIAGFSDTSVPTPEPACYNPVFNPDCFIVHAFVWRDDHLKDLGTLPGGNFSATLAINQSGQIAGVSENSQIDPATGNPVFHAVLWQNDKIKDLGTLGGTSSFAADVNNIGQITGVALNDVPDPLSLLGLGSQTTLTQTHGFLWQHGKMHDLGTMGGPDSWAELVNDRGQVAGTSYKSDIVDPATGTPPVGTFLWENGRMNDLGNLGGHDGIFGTVAGLNNRGEVTGTMAVPGDQSGHAFLWNGETLSDLGTFGGTQSFARGINEAGEVTGAAYFRGDQVKHGFLWRNGVMTDLGTVDGDICSDAISVGSRGQVVGASQDIAGGCNTWTHAFLWESGGPSVDLNTLIPPGSTLQLFVAVGINDRGEIVGGGMLPTCPDSDHCDVKHAFLLIPCDENHPDLEGCNYNLVEDTTPPIKSAVLTHVPSLGAHASATPNGLKAAMRERFARRYHLPNPGSPNN